MDSSYVLIGGVITSFLLGVFFVFKFHVLNQKVYMEQSNKVLKEVSLKYRELLGDEIEEYQKIYEVIKYQIDCALESMELSNEEVKALNRTVIQQSSKIIDTLSEVQNLSNRSSELEKQILKYKAIIERKGWKHGS